MFQVRRELHMKTPLFSVNTYTDDVILSDTRVNVTSNMIYDSLFIRKQEYSGCESPKH